MVFFLIKSEFRKDCIFLKKFLLFYLLISQALISCKMKIFPDHFSKEDPNFSQSQVKDITYQEFYYDLGYFTQKTTKYRSPKYGINYRPVQCFSNTDQPLIYDDNDQISFFAPTSQAINDPTSTLDQENYYDDVKLFRNTIKGNSFTCPSPIRAFHNTDRYEINLTIPVMSNAGAKLEMFLVSNDSQINQSIGNFSIPARTCKRIDFLIIPNEKINYTTEMSFQFTRDEIVEPVSIYGDPDLFIQFISDNEIILSNYRAIFNDSTTKTGQKHTSSMVRSKNGILHNCTKDSDCIMGFMCSFFDCIPCHSSCSECYQGDENAAGMNYCKECNSLSNNIYPQDGYCDIGYVDVSLFKDIEVKVKPDGQDFNDRETLGFWIFFSNTGYSNLDREYFDNRE